MPQSNTIGHFYLSLFDYTLFCNIRLINVIFLAFSTDSLFLLSVIVLLIVENALSMPAVLDGNCSRVSHILRKWTGIFTWLSS